MQIQAYDTSFALRTRNLSGNASVICGKIPGVELSELILTCENLQGQNFQDGGGGSLSRAHSNKLKNVGLIFASFSNRVSICLLTVIFIVLSLN